MTGTDGSQAFYQPPTIKSASRHGQSLDEDSADGGDNVAENKTQELDLNPESEDNNDIRSSDYNDIWVVPF